MAERFLQDLTKNTFGILTSKVNGFTEKHPKHIHFLVKILDSIIYNNLDVKDPYFRIQETQQHLLDGGSVILNFAPHTTSLDPFITSLFVRRFLTQHPFSWISSAKFHRELVEKFGLDDMGLMVEGSEYLDKYYTLNRYPVFQPYMFDPNYHHPIPPELHQEAKGISISSIRRARRFLESGPGVLGISFEGHRGKTGGLQQAEPIVNLLGKPSDDRSIKILTLLMQGTHALQDPNNPGIANLNPFAPIGIAVGPLVDHEYAAKIAENYEWTDPKRGKFGVADSVMLLTAMLGMQEIIPGVDPYGVYTPKNISSLP